MAAPSETAPADTPDIDPAAIEFLDCEGLKRVGRLWECTRGGSTVFILEGGTARSAFDLVRRPPNYNPNGSVLFESGHGFVYVADGFPEGFPQIFEAPLPLPGMMTVDTDTL